MRSPLPLVRVAPFFRRRPPRIRFRLAARLHAVHAERRRVSGFHELVPRRDLQGCGAEAEESEVLRRQRPGRSSARGQRRVAGIVSDELVPEVAFTRVRLHGDELDIGETFGVRGRSVAGTGGRWALALAAAVPAQHGDACAHVLEAAWCAILADPKTYGPHLADGDLVSWTLWKIEEAHERDDAVWRPLWSDSGLRRRARNSQRRL